MSSGTVRWLKLSIGLATTAGFVWLLAREVDLDALGRAFTGLSVSAVLLALAFLAAGWATRIVRWWWMLRALEPTLPLGACAGPFLAGMAVNNVAPSGPATRCGSWAFAASFGRRPWPWREPSWSSGSWTWPS